jgi:predicted DNA-binding transcriptional regulator AlpA
VKPTKRPAAQVAFAEKAADTKAAAMISRPGLRLLDKSEVCAIANVTFPKIWTWQRSGMFPRARVVGGKSMWLSSEIDDWLTSLPVRPLKGDAPVEAA